MRKKTICFVMSLIFAACVFIPCSVDAAVTGLVSLNKYYLSNYSTGRYLAPVSSAQTSGVAVFTDTPNGSTLSQWRIEFQSDNTAVLWNVYSTYGLRLTNTSGVPVLSNSAPIGNSKFVITRITSGTYEGLYTISNDSKYLTQRTSTYNYEVYLADSPVSRSYWSFIECSRDYAMLFSFNYPGYSSTSNNYLFETAFDGMYYNALAETNETADYGYDMLRDEETDIWVFHGHGSGCNIFFYSSNGSVNGNITVNSSTASSYTPRYYISSLSANELAGEKLVLYLGCSTGCSNGTYNLVDVTFYKGAHYVLGVTVDALTVANAAFLSAFITEMLDFNSRVATCVSKGLDAARNLDPDYSLHVRGDSRQILNP